MSESKQSDDAVVDGPETNYYGNSNVVSRSDLSENEEDALMLFIEAVGYHPDMIATLLNHDTKAKVENFYNKKMKCKDFQQKIEKINRFRWPMEEGQLCDLFRRLLSKLESIHGEKLDVGNKYTLLKNESLQLKTYCKTSTGTKQEEKEQEQKIDKGKDKEAEQEKAKKKKKNTEGSTNGISIAVAATEIKSNQMVSNQGGMNIKGSIWAANTQNW